MTLPDVIVEASLAGPSTSTYLHLDDVVRGRLNTGTLAPDDVFTDISEYLVRALRVQRGATRVESPILRYEAGTATIALRNDDRRFDPTNLDGPYVAGGVTQLTPMRAVRVRATYNGITYHLFRGYADDWQVEYIPGADYSVTMLRATDATKVLNNHNRTAGGAVGAGEDSGARVDRILDSINWNDADRLISVGKSTLQATTLGGNAWSELLLVQDSEAGGIYIDAEGRVVFENRHAPLESTRSRNVQALFGDDPVTGVTTAVNMVKNPSLETNSTGWSVGGFANQPSIARSSTRAQFGTWSLLGTWATASTGDLPLIQYEMSELTIGQVYTASLYAYVPTGSPGVSIVIAAGPLGATTFATKDTWVRIGVTFTAASAAPLIQIWPLTDTVAGNTVYLDGLVVEEGNTATTYVDGTQTHCEWDGTAHASTSRRLPEMRYADVAIVYDGNTLANKVTATRVGGAAQTAEDSASQTAYLTQTYERSDLLLETDQKAADWAAWVMGQAKDPELRFAQLTLRPLADPDALFPLALGLRFGDRIRISRVPPGGGDPIVREVLIRGVTHETGGADWVTTFSLQAADKTAYLLLDHVSLGRLNFNQLAGF